MSSRSDGRRSAAWARPVAGRPVPPATPRAVSSASASCRRHARNKPVVERSGTTGKPEPKSAAPRRGARAVEPRRRASPWLCFIMGGPPGLLATPWECAGRACSLYGSPHLHRDRRAERRLARDRSARPSSHRFVDTQFGLDLRPQPSAFLPISAVFCSASLPSATGRLPGSPFRTPQRGEETQRNRGLFWTAPANAARRRFRPPSSARPRSSIRIKNRAGGPSEGGCGVEARGVGALSRLARPAGAHGWVGAVGPVVPLRSTTG